MRKILIYFSIIYTIGIVFFSDNGFGYKTNFSSENG